MELKTEAIRLTARVLPDEWNERRLGDLIDLMPSGIYGAETGGHGLIGCPVATTAHIDSDDKWNEKDMNVRFFTREQLGRYMPVAGDLIVVKSSGSAEKIQSGKIGFVDRSKEQAFVFSNFLMLLRPKQVDPLFLFFYLCSHSVKKELPNLVEASTYPNIRIDDYLALPIPVPPLPEQRAIATALSDVDGLLAGLDALIAKKKALKQGAMQQLLTGKQRLPGFTGEWVVRKLGAFADMSSGGTPLSNVPEYYGGHIPWVSIADMTNRGKYITDTDRKLTDKGLASSAARIYPARTLLYAMYASLGECSIALVEVSSSQAILGIQPRKGLDLEYLYFQLLSRRDQVKTMGQQGTQSNLNKAMVQDFDIPIPPLEEQAAIAEVLSDMDAELGALEARRAKTALLKQGMMQELLTGRVRLV